MNGIAGLKIMKGRVPVYLFVITLLVAGCSLAVRPDTPQSTEIAATPSDDDVNAIAHKLFCPVCENTPLDVCPTQACADWRGLIRQMLSEGKSESEIIQSFVTNSGMRVLGAPPAKGINLLAYIVPPVVFVAGLILLLLAFRAWKRMPASGTLADGTTENTKKPKSTSDKAYIEMFEKELNKRK